MSTQIRKLWSSWCILYMITIKNKSLLAAAWCLQHAQSQRTSFVCRKVCLRAVCADVVQMTMGNKRHGYLEHILTVRQKMLMPFWANTHTHMFLHNCWKLRDCVFFGKCLWIPPRSWWWWPRSTWRCCQCRYDQRCSGQIVFRRGLLAKVYKNKLVDYGWPIAQLQHFVMMQPLLTIVGNEPLKLRSR